MITLNVLASVISCCIQSELNIDTQTRKRFLKTKTEHPNKFQKAKVLKFEGREKGNSMLLKITSCRNIILTDAHQ